MEHARAHFRRRRATQLPPQDENSARRFSTISLKEKKKLQGRGGWYASCVPFAQHLPTPE
jgi:hypothetical protein